MDYELWALQQESRALRDLRTQIAGIWADQAARTLNTRYLDPHEGDAREVCRTLDLQQQELARMWETLALADEQLAIAAEQSQHVAEALHDARRDLTDAARYYDRFASNHVEAQARLPLVEEFVNRANEACG